MHAIYNAPPQTPPRPKFPGLYCNRDTGTVILASGNGGGLTLCGVVVVATTALFPRPPEPLAPGEWRNAPPQPVALGEYRENWDTSQFDRCVPGTEVILKE